MLPRALFAGLIDDAAVFPPGNAPLDAAVAAHRRVRRSAHSDLIGPLLLPPNAIPAALDLAGLADLAGPDDGEVRDEQPLDIAIAARPGTPREDTEYAAQLAAADSRVVLRAVEVGWEDGWERADLAAPVLVVELPRGTEQPLPLTDLAIARAERPDTQWLAKFRTGATDSWAWPTENELARTIQNALAMDVPLKLTGGLHHAVRGRHTGEEHGVLNVLGAYAAARAGRSVPFLASVLAERDPAVLIAALTDLTPHQVSMLRADFPSYGCCDVLEPLAELTTLDLLTKDPA